MSSAGRRLMVALVVIVCMSWWSTGSWAAVTRTGAANGASCAAHGVVSRVGADAEGDLPVLFVHGLDSSPEETWLNDGAPGAELYTSVGQLPDVASYSFDYSPHALSWVTTPDISERLADALTCLRRLTDRAVVAVGHSLGGLAIREAQARLATPGGIVDDTLQFVITIGTPTAGSQALAAVDTITSGRSLAAAGISVLLTACGFAAEATNPCGVFGLARSPAGRALTPSSPELFALPPWQIARVHTIATNIKLETRLNSVVFVADLGDVLVSVDSAHAGGVPSDTPFTVECEIPSGNAINMVSDVANSDCYHGRQVGHPLVVQRVRSMVQFIASGSPPPAPPTTPGSSNNPGSVEIGGPLGTLIALLGPFLPLIIVVYLIRRFFRRRKRVGSW